MSQTTRPGSDLRALLNDLVSRVPEARHAIVLSEDGLLLAASQEIAQSDAEHLAALASGYQSLARGTGRVFRHGPVLQTIVEMGSAFLFVTVAGQNTCIAVVSSAESDVGQIAYEIAMLVQQVGPTLSTTPRRAFPEPGASASGIFP